MRESNWTIARDLAVVAMIILFIAVATIWATHIQTEQQFYASQGSTGPGTKGVR